MSEEKADIIFRTKDRSNSTERIMQPIVPSRSLTPISASSSSLPLPKELQWLPQYVTNGTTLGIGYLNLSLEKTNQIIKFLRIRPSITSVNLAYNQTDTEGVAALAEALKTNISITSVNLEWNEIGPKGAAAINKILTRNKLIPELLAKEKYEELKELLEKDTCTDTKVYFYACYGKGNKFRAESAWALWQDLRSFHKLHYEHGYYTDGFDKYLDKYLNKAQTTELFSASGFQDERLFNIKNPVEAITKLQSYFEEYTDGFTMVSEDGNKYPIAETLLLLRSSWYKVAHTFSNDNPKIFKNDFYEKSTDPLWLKHFCLWLHGESLPDVEIEKLLLSKRQLFDVPTEIEGEKTPNNSPTTLTDEPGYFGIRDGENNSYWSMLEAERRKLQKQIEAKKDLEKQSEKPLEAKKDLEKQPEKPLKAQDDDDPGSYPGCSIM